HIWLETLADRVDLFGLGEALPNVVLGQELDARHRGDDVVVEAEPVGGAKSRELAIDGGRGRLLLEPELRVPQDVRARHPNGLNALEESEQLIRAETESIGAGHRPWMPPVERVHESLEPLFSLPPRGLERQGACIVDQRAIARPGSGRNNGTG